MADAALEVGGAQPAFLITRACVVPSLCPPSGPFGTGVGDTLGDWSLTDCDGVEHSFHDLCELRAVHIFSFAGW